MKTNKNDSNQQASRNPLKNVKNYYNIIKNLNPFISFDYDNNFLLIYFKKEDLDILINFVLNNNIVHDNNKDFILLTLLMQIIENGNK